MAFFGVDLGLERRKTIEAAFKVDLRWAHLHAVP